jgi:REP element-mobilizing transposase RayT
MRQASFEFKTRGGKRRGAGAKPKGRVAGVSHDARPKLDGRTPVHVTLRVSRVIPSLRSQALIKVVRGAFSAGKDRLGLRLVQYAVQPDHLHLVLEPEDKSALSRGMQGLNIRLAKALNRALRRKGRVFVDRYHAQPLRSPKQVRAALRYVLLQQRRHAAKAGGGMTTQLDPCSSAPLFDGWGNTQPRHGPWTATVVPAQTWLLCVGWRRHGLLSTTDVPGLAS